jgi:hypothetical protein
MATTMGDNMGEGLPQQNQPVSSFTAPTIYIDTQHEDLVHDSQLDFYGSKLATCSSGTLFSFPYCLALKERQTHLKYMCFVNTLFMRRSYN